MRDLRGCQARVAREFFSKTQWTESTATGSLRDKCSRANLSQRVATETAEREPILFSNKEEAIRFTM